MKIFDNMSRHTARKIIDIQLDIPNNSINCFEGLSRSSGDKAKIGLGE